MQTNNFLIFPSNNGDIQHLQIADEMEKERRYFQLQMCEVLYEV